MSRLTGRRIDVTEDNDKFPRVNTRLTKDALARLNSACAKREREEPRTCPQGTILTELIMEHLPEAEDIPEPVEKKRPRKRGPKSAKRGRPPKSATAEDTLAAAS
jgi:hypothetical protein